MKMANKHMKSLSTSLAIREYKSKYKDNSLPTCYERLTYKRQTVASVDKHVEKPELLHTGSGTVK